MTATEQLQLHGMHTSTRQLPFGGMTYEPTEDGQRLARQFGAVRALMLDGEWWTLHDLASAVGAPEASVSARVRDLRKPEFGGYLVERRRVPPPARGLHEYRLVIPTPPTPLHPHPTPTHPEPESAA